MLDAGINDINIAKNLIVILNIISVSLVVKYIINVNIEINIPAGIIIFKALLYIPNIINKIYKPANQYNVLKLFAYKSPKIIIIIDDNNDIKGCILNLKFTCFS